MNRRKSASLEFYDDQERCLLNHIQDEGLIVDDITDTSVVAIRPAPAPAAGAAPGHFSNSAAQVLPANGSIASTDDSEQEPDSKGNGELEDTLGEAVKRSVET